jgi:predicted CoA-substrate-specific enzyme activase
MKLYAAGVDVGSTQTKAIILDERRAVAGRALRSTGARIVDSAEAALRDAAADAGIDRSKIAYVVGTGYGRFKVTSGDAQITEISCHARGAHFFFPGTRTVIDMGGQDTKAIRVSPEGEVLDFAMNDKCAAGTGRFLGTSAEVLALSLDEIGPLALTGTEPVRMSSVCTVFVESDIMSYLAQKKTVENILAGIHRAIATRTASLVRRVGIEPETTFTGGVSRNTGMVKCLEEVLSVRLNVSPESHYMGALGAAIFALERAEASVQDGADVGLKGWSDGTETEE